MAVVYALSEFTDEKGEDWMVKIVDGTISTGDLNHRFTLGPDGFRLTYDYDNFDRAKPVLGSRVQLTLFHPDSSDAAFNTLYSNLDSAAEGTYRVEIYRDPDGTNEKWWVGAVLPEQTVIPDEYPFAAVQITAADGLANLKGIDYNNSGAAYTGDEVLTGHLYKALSKVHCFNFWASGDTFVKFFEDFIGKEYSDSISSGQNQQLNFAKVNHNSFYNKDSNGINQFFSAYDVLESIALTFNSVVFMAQGSFWLVPLGAIQGHGSNKLDIAHFIAGNGTVTYNSSTNMAFTVPFGNDNNDYEKLQGWERSSSPAFKEVLRNRDYQGAKPLLFDSHYTEANMVSGTVISDEDVAYSAGQQLIIQGHTLYVFNGDGSASGQSRNGRIKLSIKVKVGDAGGTVRYLYRQVGFPGTFQHYQLYYDAYDGATYDGGFYDVAQYSGTSWNASDNNYELVSQEFDVRNGTNGSMSIPWQIKTPALDADASGLQVSVTITGVDYEGSNDADFVDTSDADFNTYELSARLYDNGNPQTSDHAEIKATNPDDARYNMDQGKTLLGDTITDADLGEIKVYNGSAYVSPTEWDSNFNTASNLGINALGVQERLGGNADAVRVERGTLFRTGTKYIHPYTILTNIADSSNFYQLTGISFIASRCEYDIECMYLTRNVTGITIAQDDVKGPLTDGDIGTDSDPNGPADGTIPAESISKLLNINTDAYGISGLKMTNGSSGTNTYVFPTALPTSTHRNLLILKDDGALLKVASGSAGQVLTMHSGGLYPEWAAASGGESGWFNSTTLMKVMPTEFMANDDGGAAVIEDDTADKLGLRTDNRFTELYVTKAIPTGYKATHVQVYASASTSSAVTVRQFDQTDGDLSGSTTGDFNSNIDISDITSSATANIMIKCTGSTTVFIYGADITIAAV